MKIGLLSSALLLLFQIGFCQTQGKKDSYSTFCDNRIETFTPDKAQRYYFMLNLPSAPSTCFSIDNFGSITTTRCDKFSFESAGYSLNHKANLYYIKRADGLCLTVQMYSGPGFLPKSAQIDKYQKWMLIKEKSGYLMTCPALSPIPFLSIMNNNTRIGYNGCKDSKTIFYLGKEPKVKSTSKSKPSSQFSNSGRN